MCVSKNDIFLYVMSRSEKHRNFCFYAMYLYVIIGKYGFRERRNFTELPERKSATSLVAKVLAVPVNNGVLGVLKMYAETGGAEAQNEAQNLTRSLPDRQVKTFSSLK